MCGVSPIFVYRMSHVWACACVLDEPCMDLCLCIGWDLYMRIRWASEGVGKRGGLWRYF